MAIADVPAVQRRLTELTLDFLATLELERGLSRNTLTAYASDLQQYGAFLARRDRDPLTVNPADLAAFVTELASGHDDRPPVAPATLQRKIACLRSFYRHLRREELIDHDPTAQLRPPRSRGRLPKVLSRDEVARLLDQPRGGSPGALRDRALLETMYACGLRASEAVSLELIELDLDAGILRARGKGSKERMVPVGSKAVSSLRAYLDQGRPRLIGLRDEPRVFVNLRGGDLIVYTSQDSVLQIAAHVDVVAPAPLYEICARVRREMVGEHAVGRVIARPFAGAPGAFARTDGRRDYAVMPTDPSYLDALRARHVPVHVVGKVGQLFAGRGIDVEHAGASNAAALDRTARLIDELDGGFVFTNLIETDQVYGHRHDFPGFAGALQRIDAAVAGWLERLRDDDLLVLTADHGVDLTSPRTDHTREHVPLLARFPGHGGRRHDGPLADVGASVLAWLTGAEDPSLPGTPFL
jgi:site-specific recombinase XerD